MRHLCTAVRFIETWWLPGAAGKVEIKSLFNSLLRQSSILQGERVLEVGDGDGCSSMKVLNSTELYT